MTRGQFGADPRRTDERADSFAEQVGRALVRVANATARDLSETPGELDLVSVRAAWRRQVADVLLPVVEREWRRSADETWRAVADVFGEAADAPVVVAAVVGDQAAPQALVNAGTVSVPKVSILAARAYLETAENRLASVGDLLWAEMRAQLVEGLVAGEGSADVARRLRKTADLTTARATVIARTEVIGATNRGAYAQMLATGLGGTKTWLATNDGRTRPSHAAADGATAEMTGTFTVGGHAMDGPHDPTAPPAETISCRCTLTYDVDEPSTEITSNVLTTGERTFDDRFSSAVSGERAEEISPAHVDRLTDQGQLKAARSYAFTRYKPINTRLRGGAQLGDLYGEDVRQLDNVFAEARLTQPVGTYRGIVEPDRMFGEAWGDHDLTGLEWVDDGYTSTTAVETIADGFAMRLPSSAVKLRILVPRDAKVLTIGGREHELLLNRGTRFKVVQDNGVDDSGIRLLDVEVVLS